MRTIFLLLTLIMVNSPMMAFQSVSDECIDAIELVLNVNNTASATFNTDLVTISPDAPSCDNGSRDGWYELTMPFNGNMLINGSANTEYAVYDGCGGTQVSCVRPGWHTFNLSNGQTYYIRAWRVNSTSGEMSFNLLVTPLISNDECSSAQALIFDGNNYSGGNVLNTNGATPSPEPISCENNPRDGWYSFTMPFNGNALMTGGANSEYAIYDGCGGSEVFCNREGSHAYDLKSGVKYYLRPYRRNGTDGNMTFNVQLTPSIVNDECTDAILLTFDVNNNSYNSLNTNGATISPGNPSCQSNPRDGWYRFISPINGSYRIDGGANTEFAIYSGCGGTQLACFRDDGSFSVENDEEYWIRSWKTNGSDGNMRIDLLGTETVLPVVLSEFKAISNESFNLLSWITQSEINTEYFVVERSVDQSTWREIGMVEAIGNSIEEQYYSFNDTGINHTAYYRLMIMDYDGYSEYSKIVKVNRETDHEWTLFPNPVSDFLHIKGTKESVNIKIYNAYGNMMHNSELNQGPLYIANWEKGLYILKINDGIYSRSIQFIKM